MILDYIHRADTINIVAAGIMCLLQIADWQTTKTFLKLGIREGNPIGAFLIDKLGIDATGVLKLIIATPLLVVANNIVLSGVLLAIIGYAVAGNVRAIKKQRERLKARLNG